MKNKAQQDKINFHVSEMYHEHNAVAGYRKIHKYLRKAGFKYSISVVRKTMQHLGLYAIVQKHKNNRKQPSLSQAFPNRVDGNFKALSPNKVWYSDFTYIKLSSGIFVYACLIIDAFDNSIVGCSVSKNIDAMLAKTTLEVALRKVDKIDGLILHTDQGIQYRSAIFTTYCKTIGVIQSMSRTATPTDNAICENVIGKIKNELINHYQYKHIHQVSEAILHYCYHYYNTKRVNQALDYLTPLEYRSNYFNLS